MSATEHRAGFVALIGLPNVGKSTLLNRVLRRKLAIVTPKPQTTRNRILGIESRPDVQFLFLDTPGLHQARNLMGQRMNKVAQQTSADADVVLWLVDAEAGLREQDREVGKDLATGRGELVIALNKIDRKKRPELLPVLQELGEIAPKREIVPVSAKDGENVEELLGVVRDALPVSPPLYPPDAQTDMPERFFASEMIREQLFLGTHEEVPYQCAVRIDAFEERAGKNLVVIMASILVGRKSQKAIVIGEKGTRLRDIGKRARLELERFLGVRVYLDLQVKVDPRWFTKERALSELGL